jgi:hypothetical protein
VDGTGSGSCPMAGFSISGVEPRGSAITVLIQRLKISRKQNLTSLLKPSHSGFYFHGNV